MKTLDLFSGIGGFSLGLERAGMKTSAFCEIDSFCRKVLRKHWPKTPIFEDIKTLHEKDISESVDVVCGGPPCQPASCAGWKRGTADDRWLWPEVIRIVREFSPIWCIFENVPGMLNLGRGVAIEQVCIGLESEGYEVWPFIVPACGVGLPHNRNRVWIVAHAASKYGVSRPIYSGNAKKNVQKTKTFWNEFWFYNHGNDNVEFRQKDQHIICGADAGVPDRLDRLKALGNAVVPQIVENIGRAIMEAEGE